MKKILIILLIFCILPIQKVNAVDDDITPNAKSAILIEANSKQILYQKNAQEKLYPASTTKIMTMILMFEAINDHFSVEWSDDYSSVIFNVDSEGLFSDDPNEALENMLK